MDPVIEERLVAVVVSFHREATLAQVLDSIDAQTIRPASVLVIDNASSAKVRHMVEQQGLPLQYVDAGSNIGPAGAMALAYELLHDAPDTTWLLRLDDDKPLPDETLCADLWQMATDLEAIDPNVAGVGVVGARFDSRRGRLVRVPDSELHGAVFVDGLGSGHFPMYKLGPMRQAGPFLASLFFGFTENEYALRLRAAGFTFYAHGDRWLPLRLARTRAVGEARPDGDADWRRFHALRNEIYALRNLDHPLAAVIRSIRGLARPIVRGWRQPGDAVHRLRLSAAAIRDGWRGKLGVRHDLLPRFGEGEEATRT